MGHRAGLIVMIDCIFDGSIHVERMVKNFNSSSKKNFGSHMHVITLPETLAEVGRFRGQPSCRLIRYSCLWYSQVALDYLSSDCRTEPVLIHWINKLVLVLHMYIRTYEQ